MKMYHFHSLYLYNNKFGGKGKEALLLHQNSYLNKGIRSLSIHKQMYHFGRKFCYNSSSLQEVEYYQDKHLGRGICS